MIRVTDQIGRSVEIPEIPKRIVSLVPSQTELLSFLGLDDRVVGITKFCVHPEDWHKSKTRVGGTKILKNSVIDSLKPDLIIANKEENTREDIAKLSALYPVWVSDVHCLTDALQMIESVGSITQSHEKAKDLSFQIESSFSQLFNPIKKRALYLIWRKPYMAIGKNTFVDDMLVRCGFENAITDQRYPEISDSDLINLDPEIVLFSSEPYPFKEHHMNTVQKILPNAKLQLVDGEPFSWYGSRLLKSVDYFNKLIGVLNGEAI